MKMKSQRAIALSLLSLLAAASFAGEAAAQKESFATGTPLWVLGFAIVIALVFVLIPICALLFKADDKVEG